MAPSWRAKAITGVVLFLEGCSLYLIISVASHLAKFEALQMPFWLVLLALTWGYGLSSWALTLRVTPVMRGLTGLALGVPSLLVLTAWNAGHALLPFGLLTSGGMGGVGLFAGFHDIPAGHLVARRRDFPRRSDPGRRALRLPDWHGGLADGRPDRRRHGGQHRQRLPRAGILRHRAARHGPGPLLRRRRRRAPDARAVALAHSRLRRRRAGPRPARQRPRPGRTGRRDPRRGAHGGGGGIPHTGAAAAGHRLLGRGTGQHRQLVLRHPGGRRPGGPAGGSAPASTSSTKACGRPKGRRAAAYCSPR